MNVNELIAAINDGTYDENLKAVYVTDEAVQSQKPRYVETLNDFGELFGYDREVNIMSAPGRTEVCGNHTDHNNGKVLAASINLDAIAVVSKNDDNIIRVKSKGHKMNVVDLNDLVPNEANFGSSTSDVMGGSGLSSSAAFEVLLGSVLSYMFNDGKISPVEIAKVAQYSENVFFGKPCGLLDQMASSVGTFVTIDFKSVKDPVIKKIVFDFSKSGHSLCIVDTHGNHSDLTDDYAAVRTEMESVAQALGKNVLREVSYEEFFAALPELTGRVNDRAILRAIHFFNERE